MTLSIKKIAEMANVSTATVSRAINNKHRGNMSQETYQRIQEIIKKTEYVPHAIAYGLRTGSTKAIGIVLPDNTNPYYAQLSNAIENECYLSGYTAFICNTNQDTEREKRYMRLLSSQRVAGIILCSTGLLYSDIKETIAGYAPRIVLVDEYVEGFKGAVVIGDDFQGGYLGMEYLFSLNHEKILLITGPPNLSSTHDRLEGVSACLKHYGKESTCSVTQNGDYTLKSAYDLITELLQRESLKFSAIFAFNDLMAIGAMKALSEHSIRIPEDISVLGYDDIFLNNLVRPALTSVAAPIQKMGILCCDIVIKKGRLPSPRKIDLKPKLMIRESCRSL